MRVCLFDLNGTVLDDMPVWRETLNRLFGKFGKMPPTTAEFFRELEEAHGDYLQIYRKRGIEVERDKLNDIFGKIYEELVVRVQLTPNAAYTLDALAKAGVVLGLVTTQTEELSVPILKRFGLNDLFKHVRYHAIDKKTAIGGTILEEGAPKSECYYVGDAPSDVRHANSAGVVSVAFLGGHVPEELVMAAKPKMTIKDFRELISFV